MTTTTDEKAVIFDKIITNHSMFNELKTQIDAVETARYKRTKRLAGSVWEGFYENDQYLSFTTTNNKKGNEIAAMQKQILEDTGFLENNRCFEMFRTHSINWDKVRLLEG